MDKDILFQDMTARLYDPREWLMFYRNLWMRTIIARTVDVQTDTTDKAKDPEMEVDSGERNPMTGQVIIIPVKKRLEYRKMNVQEAVDIVAAIDVLLALNNDELTARWSADALKVDADILPPAAKAAEPKAGDVCDLDDGSGKGTLAEVNGNLICVTPETASDQEVAPTDQEATPADAEVTPTAADESTT